MSMEGIRAGHAATREVALNQNEVALIGRVLEGRKDLFGDLLQPHYTSLRHLIRSKMANDPEAEDVVQETIIKAFTRLHQFRFEANFRTWLFRIAINKVLEWRRSSSARRVRTTFVASVEELNPADGAQSPLEQCERGEMARRLQYAVAKLPEPYRVAVQLMDFEGLSTSETADLLRLSVPAVKARHHRARLQLIRDFSSLRRAWR